MSFNKIHCFSRTNQNFMKKIFLIITLLFTEGNADSLASTPLDSLFSSSEFVGIVTIKYGSVGENGWAIYKADVEMLFKGDSSRKEILFGFYRGYSVGWQYLVFLNSENMKYEPDSSITVQLVPQEFKALNPPYEITWEGFGNMKIEYTITLHDFGVRIACDYIVPPKILETIPITSQDDELWNYRWIKKNDMIKYLNQLKSTNR